MTGKWAERLDPDTPHPLWGEHRARYRFAAGWATGRRVLDAACGNGYGSEILRRARARQVTGVDIAEEATQLARARYGGPGTRFVRADLERLPFPEASFDLVTSFETIEHVLRPDRVVTELRRVLSPAGVLIMSTPNGALFEGGHSGNPFHVKEFTLGELQSLLASFGSVSIYGQRLRRSSGVLDYSGRPRPQTRQHDRGAWRCLRRALFSHLPPTIQDLVWRAVRGEPYYPADTEFDFVLENADTFPILVAVCRRDQAG